MSEAGAATGNFHLLRQRLFATLWAATVMGNTGSFLRDVASAWLTTGLSSSPTAVATVQAAATLPVFLLSIPAGVLADTLDRRKFLMAIQLMLACVSIGLMLLSASGAQSVSSLAVLTFMGGVGAALMGPTWQAIVPELVPRKDLRNAVALNSLGVNISRAIGPAIGGLLLSSLGAAFTYGIDVLTYLFVVAALLGWRRPEQPRDELSEHFAGAFRAGVRYAKASRELQTVLFRAFLFFMLSSAVWALLPLVARELLNGGSSLYGALLGAVGVGAIGGAILLPRLRTQLDADGMLLFSALATAAVMALLASSPPQWLALCVLLFLGVAWIAALTTLNGVTQSILPNWVRGRSLAVYLTVFNGAMTIGSLGWGLVAQRSSIAMALLLGATCLVLTGLLAHRVRLPAGEADLLPSGHWPEPPTASSPDVERGPVLVIIEYTVDPKDRAGMLDALSKLSAERRKDGAYAWGVMEDAADPSVMIEWFMLESWGEHLRQHHRVSRADAEIQAEALGLHVGEAGPVVRHLLALGQARDTPSKR